MMRGFRTGVFLFVLALLCSASRLMQLPALTPQDVRFEQPQSFPKPVYDIASNPPTVAGFELGRKLFYDPILSSDYMTSCASCHQRFAAFAHVDHALSHGVLGKIGLRNVPALQNLVWKDAFMADGGILHLDQQPIAPITNPVEMNESLVHVLQKLQSDTAYPRMFKAAFGDSVVSSKNMLRALSQFLMLLVSANSRYDKMMRHEESFTSQEQQGLQVFRAKCAGCHPEPLFSDNSYRTILLPPDTALRDSGRARITGITGDQFRFKVPSLRNVEWTFPYMHDGRFRKLSQVLDHYAGLLPTQADAADASLGKAAGLSDEEKQSLIAFLKTLTDQQFLHDLRFADPQQRY